MLALLGLVNYIHVPGGGNNAFDVIPVDTVSNGIICTTVYGAKKEGNALDIYNCGTSGQNTLTMNGYKDMMI